MAHSEVSDKTGRTYYLHSKVVELNGAYNQTIYYFSPKVGPDAIDAMPAGYEKMENDRTGLPLLRKKK